MANSNLLDLGSSGFQDPMEAVYTSGLQEDPLSPKKLTRERRITNLRFATALLEKMIKYFDKFDKHIYFVIVRRCQLKL